MLYNKIIEFQKQGIPIVVVTAVEKQGEGPVEVGKKMIVSATNEAYGTVGGGALEFYARNKCQDVLKTRKHLLEKYLLNEGKVMVEAKTLPMVCGGVVTLYYEYIGAKEYVYLFGAGHVAAALAKVLKTMPFHITVIDERKAVIDQFKDADVMVNQPFTSYIDMHGIASDSFVVVCTPSHKDDYHVINKIIENKYQPKYVGMLCSPEKLKDYLTITYAQFGQDINLDYFYSPIGLDLGGNSPEEIAISITSEILAISNHKQGHKHMRGSVNDDTHHYWKNKR